MMDPRRGAPAVQVVADEDPLLTVDEVAALIDERVDLAAALLDDVGRR